MKINKLGLGVIALAVLAASANAAIPAGQRQALIALYNATGGDAWTDNSGWKAEPVDTDGFAMPGTENGWYGVTTDLGSTTVTGINLSANNLVGSLPTAIGDFPGLVSLNLHTNALSGSLPSSLGDLTNLTLLHLSMNQFTGTLPAELGNLINLTELDAYDNQLNGTIPAGLGNLVNLQILNMRSNLFEGTLPAELGSLAVLTQLNFHDNQLTGSIPASLGGLTNLISLRLHGNQLSGSIPVELGDLINLQELYLNNNALTGSLPTSIGGLESLLVLYLEYNQLNGPIPAEIGDLDSLLVLSLHHNLLDGPLPAQLGDLAAIEVLSLQWNEFTGSIPTELGGLSALQVLDLHHNLLSGSIPAELGSLSLLYTLYLNDNQLTGSIPAGLGALSDLGYLRLDENQLSGAIPAELGGLTDLLDLWLCKNRLTGAIPASLGNLVNLEYLHLHSNALEGAIPAALANLTALLPEGTDIGYNALYATEEALITFLNSKDADWAATQTIAPSQVTATSLDNAVILVSWLPIVYTGDTGYYAVYSSTTAGGSYALAGQTLNKTASSLSVSGLNPGQTYYFVVRTHTDAHSGNANAVDSAYSAEVSATAWTQVNVRVAGTVLAAGSPLSGVLMSGLPGGPVTNSSGVYDVIVPAGWSGTVTPSLEGYTFDPPSRIYTTLTADQLAQDYAATLILATITVTAPNGGESWQAGTSHDITWTHTGLSGSVTIDLYKAAVYQETLGTADVSALMYSWAIASGETPGTDYRVLVWQGSVSDGSNADFAITAAAIRKDDLLATWDGQGVYYKNSDTGAWVRMASPATMITAGDFDGDGIDDLAGLWPSQGGIWVLYSHNSTWARLSSTARYIAAGDMNGDGRDDLLGTWDGQGVYYRNSISGIWVRMASEATMIACGDLDGDGTDDLIGLWPSQGGIWVKYSQSGLWARISSTAVHIAAGDMNGDGRDDLLGTWDGQGVYYRNSMTGAWIRMASPATLITTGDLDGDATGDLIGIWPTQGGVWAKYSHNSAWALLGSTARDISSGKMRPAPAGAPAAAAEEPLALTLPMGGDEPGPEGARGFRDESDRGPGGTRFVYLEDKNQVPVERRKGGAAALPAPGPGEAGFVAADQPRLFPGEKVADEKADKPRKK
jgi:Leucine-rich repeat (LRR) protein